MLQPVPTLWPSRAVWVRRLLSLPFGPVLWESQSWYQSLRKNIGGDGADRYMDG
jgi:hypothetical protein